LSFRKRNSRIKPKYNHAKDRKDYLKLIKDLRRDEDTILLNKPVKNVKKYSSSFKYWTSATPWGLDSVVQRTVKDFTRADWKANGFDWWKRNHPIRLDRGAHFSYEGKYASKFGKRDEKPYPSVTSAVKYAKSSHCPKEMRRDIEYDGVLPGTHVCYSSGFDAFNWNREARKPKGNVKTKLAISKVIERISQGEDVYCCMPKPWHVWLVESPITTNPGGDWGGGGGTKFNYFCSAAAAAEKILALILSGDKLDSSFITRFAGKSKAVRNKSDFQTVASRPLEMEDMVLMIIGKVLCGEFEHKIKLSHHTPFVIGTSTMTGEMEKSEIWNKLYKYGIEADASNHDAMVTDDEIGNAVGIIRGAYPTSGNLDNAFMHLAKWISCRNSVTEDGHVLSHRGSMCTGSFSTCLVNSLVTAIRVERFMGEYVAAAYCGDFMYHVLGDDVKIIYDNEVGWDKKKVETWVWRKLGFLWKVERFGNTISYDAYDSVTFLKHCSVFYKNKAVVTVPPDALFKRLTVPSYTRIRNAFDYKDYLLSNAATNMSHPQTALIYAGLCVYNDLELSNEKLNDFEIQQRINSLQKHVIILSSLRGNNQFFDKTLSKLAGRVIKPRASALDCSYLYPVNEVLVENWLYDNSDRKYFSKPSINSRLEWFTRHSCTLTQIVDPVLDLPRLNKRKFRRLNISSRIFKKNLSSLIRICTSSGYDQTKVNKLIFIKKGL
jgi:hypothetical protein